MTPVPQCSGEIFPAPNRLALWTADVSLAELSPKVLLCAALGLSAHALAAHFESLLPVGNTTTSNVSA
jgi:hypothetical protein